MENYGEWKVTSNSVDGEKLYSVYRLRDTSRTDHSGNRDYVMGFTKDKDFCQDLADGLNSMEIITFMDLTTARTVVRCALAGIPDKIKNQYAYGIKKIKSLC